MATDKTIHRLVKGSWKKVPGLAATISGGVNGKPWVVNDKGALYVMK